MKKGGEKALYQDALVRNSPVRGGHTPQMS